MKFSLKLGMMTGTALIGLATFAVLAYLTLHAVCINSPMYQDIALGFSLAGDCYDPPASLVAALPPAIAAEDASTPEETSKAVALLQADHQAFVASQKHYSDVLPAGPIRDLMRSTAGPVGEEWFAIAEKEYIPALLSGDHLAARKIRIEKMNSLFARHRAANDKLSELTADWIPRQEKSAGETIRTRSLELGILFIILTVVLWQTGVAISRGIVKPVRRAIGVMEAMAQGDLTQRFDVESVDEMSEMAAAMNQTIASFRKVLSAISLAATRTAAASAELTATAQDTSEHSLTNTQETHQVAAAMVEMSAAIAEVSSSAWAAAKSSSNSATAAKHGKEVVEETMQVIRHAAQNSSETLDQIESLGKSSEQIGRILGVIEEIAGQTNLLALNAAIEAARAGEQGRGFAVVAGEVRRLAERTTSATKEIGSMISSIQQETALAVHSMATGRERVDAGMGKVEECRDALGLITQSVHQEEALVQQIATAAEQQTSAVNLVTESMNSISRFTDHANAATEQTVAACSDLSRLASELERHVHSFNIG
jgi:methyl-accepting chemotaxis protein